MVLSYDPWTTHWSPERAGGAKKYGLSPDFCRGDSNIDVIPQTGAGAGAGAKSNGTGVGSGPDMTEVKKEATKVNKKLTDLTEKLDNLEMQIKMIFYVGIGLLSLNVLMIIGEAFWF